MKKLNLLKKLLDRLLKRSPPRKMVISKDSDFLVIRVDYFDPILMSFYLIFYRGDNKNGIEPRFARDFIYAPGYGGYKRNLVHRSIIEPGKKKIILFDSGNLHKEIDVTPKKVEPEETIPKEWMRLCFNSRFSIELTLPIFNIWLHQKTKVLWKNITLN